MNTRAATVNRGEIVNMYAGHRHLHNYLDRDSIIITYRERHIIIGIYITKVETVSF